MIGIMSDSHDNVSTIKQAVHVFNSANCELVIHAGDFVAPFAARELGHLACPVKAVYGNCDGEKTGLKVAFKDIGEIHEEPLSFTHKDLSYLITHIGYPPESKKVLEGIHVYIFGHTHRPEIKTKKKTLIINPGESGGWVTGKSTVVLFDTKTQNAEIILL